MKIKSRALKIALIVLGAAAAVFMLVLLVRWTDSIRSRQRQEELRRALEEVMENSGERGLLEMAGVPVNSIYYGTEGLTLFQGDNPAWTYDSDELNNLAVFQKCSPAVVHIKTSGDNSVSDFLDVNVSRGTGSGFFISADGYICTNYHVIEGAAFITVTTEDGRVYDAAVVGTDEENDTAVLKVTPVSGEFSYLEFADSDALVVGQKVLAIGNPFGYDRTMVTGIISGLSRPLRNEDGQILLGMIQTDAPINPGNSGGPLLNTRGQVIGINASIYSTTGTSQGMNFAVSANTAKASAQDLIRYGKVNRGWLDLVPVQLSRQIVDYAKLSVDRGILVSQTVPQGKAERAGIRGGTRQVLYGNSVIYLGGDIITQVNGVETQEYGDLFTALSNTRPGDRVTVVINRGGTEHTLSVELVERTAENVGWINR